MKSRKGFTLVELLVVIAILAILATASIIGFTAFTKKAQVSNDSDLVAQLNKYALAAGVSKDFKTVTDIRDELVESGFELANLKLEAEKQDYVIGFDVAQDKFVLLKGIEAAEGYEIDKKINVFAFVKTEEEATRFGNAGFSLYLQNGYDKATLAAKTGVDVGENTGITSISYTNSTAQEVVIRTNGGSLTINAASDKVYHYGNVDALDIVAVAPTSYHENGTVGYAKIANGRLVVEESAKIDGIYLVASSSGEFEGIKLAVVGSAKLPELARADVELAPGESKLVVEVQTLQTSEGTDANPEYVWISNTGTTETPVVESTISSSNSQSNYVENVVANPSQAATATKENTKQSATPITNNSEARINAVGYATLKEAFAAAKDGDTVTILKDITVDVSNSEDFGLYQAGSYYYGIFYYLEKACNIDGGNHTITTTGATKLPNNKINTGFIYYDYRAQSVSIKDLNLVSEGFMYAITYGGVEVGSMDNCHITADNCCVTISAFSTSDPRGGVLTINNSVFNFVKGELTRSDYAPSAAPIASQYGSDIVINNSSISATDGGALYVWPSGGSITANNCDLICSEAVAYSWIGNGANTTKADSIININNSTITGSSSYIVQTGNNSGQHRTASIYVDGELKATVTE